MHTPGSLRAEASLKPIWMMGDRLQLGILVLGSLVWRLPGLDFQPLWWDEGWSVYFATIDVPEMLRLTAVDIHPPLYYVLLHAWTSLFGSSVLSIRLLSVLIGTAAVPILYAVGRRLLNHRLGLIAALLLAMSPFHVYYSHEVRMYGLVTLAGLVTLYFALAWRTADAGPSHAAAGAWVGYVASAAAALYTQYYAAFLLLALNLLVAFGWWRHRPARRHVQSWLGAQGAVAALFLPWLWYAGSKLLTYVRFKVGVEQDPSYGPLTYLARHVAAFQWGHAEGALADWWWVGLVLLALPIAALWAFRAGRPWRGSASAIVWPLGIVAVTLLCGFVVNLVLPFNPPRFERLLLLALPAYLLAAATMLVWLVGEEEQGRSDRIAVAAVLVVAWFAASFVSLYFFHTVPRYPDDDYRPIAAEIAALSTPDDAIVAVHPWQAGYFYAYLADDTKRPTVVLTPRVVLPREKQIWADDPGRMAADLDALLATHERLWLADHQVMGRVLEEQIEAYLVTHAYPVLRQWHGENTILSLFAAGAPEASGATARLGDWLALTGANLPSDPIPAGTGVVPVELEWQVLTHPEGEYRIGLRLVGATGYVWAQRDARPLGGLASFADWPMGEPEIDRHGLLVPAGTPPGDYRVTVRVYDPEDLRVLPAVFAGGSGGEVTLGNVHVTRPRMPLPVEALAYGDVMTPTQPLDVELGPLRLLGYTLDDGRTLLPGESLDVALFWQAGVDPGQDYTPRLQLRDDAGNTVAELQEKPVAGTYPTAWWRAGELVRDPHALRIPAAVEPGEYRVTAGLVRMSDGHVMGEVDDREVVLGMVVVEGREHVYSAPQPTFVQQAAFGERVVLAGYELSGLPAKSGGRVHVVLYWHAIYTPERNYHAFVHLVDSAGEIVAQADGVPGEGQVPSLGWLPGEYVADPHTIPLPVDLPPGTYRLAVGLYEPVTGFRPGEPVILDTAVAIGK